jgi:DNA polymerase-3 subunit gamma/tau
MSEGHVTADQVREALGLVAEDEFIAILDLIAERRASDVFPAVARLAEAGVDFGAFLTGLADMIRAQLAVVLGGTATEVSERARDALIERKERFAAADLLRMLQAVGELEPRFRKSGQQQLLVETLLVRFALLDRSIELEDVLRTLGDGGGSGGGGGGGSGGQPSHPFARPEPRPVPRAEASGDRAANRTSAAASAAVAPAAVRPRAATPAPAPAAPVPAPVVSAAPLAARAALDLNALTGRWDDVVARLRADGKMNLAAAVSHAIPQSVTAAGIVTIELDEPNDFFAHAIATGKNDVLAAVREWFAVERIVLRRDEGAAVAPPKRLTDEMLRAERIASLRKRDPVLNAAIDALDLDVTD